MKTTLKGLGMVLLALALASCGSGRNSTSVSTGGGGGGNTSALLEIGSVLSGAFQNGALLISSSSVSASGSATVTADVVDHNAGDSLYTNSAIVTFTSSCANTGKASFNPASVTTTTGAATTTYSPSGCVGQDTITATTTANGQQISANGNIAVAPSTVGSIQFISPPDPPNISLQGMGGPTSSKVTFEVDDVNGNPVPGATVTFALSSSFGGVSVNPTSGTTDKSGQVFTFIQAGSQHTSVGVTATVTLNGVTKHATSTSVIVSTGIPTENNFTMVIATHNIEAWHISPVTDLVTLLLSDRFQTPVPDNTAIAVITDGGAIAPVSGVSTGGCTTIDGICSVNWRSQEAWPDPAEHPDFTILGHAHIFAYTVGEESFKDANNNGVFDAGDTFYDIPEQFQDRNEDGTFHSSSPTDYSYDFNQNSSYDAKDGVWEGALCENGAKCATGSGTAAAPSSTTTGIGVNDCIVVSTSFANISAPTATSVSDHVNPTTITFTLSDTNGNVMAENTKITVLQPVSVVGYTVSLSPSDDGKVYTVPDIGCASSSPGVLGSGVRTFTITVTPVPGAVTFGGTLQIQAKSPSGDTTLTSWTITLQ